MHLATSLLNWTFRVEYVTKQLSKRENTWWPRLVNWMGSWPLWVLLLRCLFPEKVLVAGMALLMPKTVLRSFCEFNSMYFTLDFWLICLPAKGTYQVSEMSFHLLIVAAWESSTTWWENIWDDGHGSFRQVGITRCWEPSPCSWT